MSHCQRERTDMTKTHSKRQAESCVHVFGSVYVLWEVCVRNKCDRECCMDLWERSCQAECDLVKRERDLVYASHSWTENKIHNHCEITENISVKYRKDKNKILLKPTSLSPSAMIFDPPIEMLICDITSCVAHHGSWTSPTNLLYMCELARIYIYPLSPSPLSLSLTPLYCKHITILSFSSSKLSV